jgi:hypothetical protein
MISRRNILTATVPGQVLVPLSTAKDKSVESFWLSHD